MHQGKFTRNPGRREGIFWGALQHIRDVHHSVFSPLTKWTEVEHSKTLAHVPYPSRLSLSAFVHDGFWPLPAKVIRKHAKC